MMLDEEGSGNGLDVSIDDAATSEGSSGSSGVGSGGGNGGRRTNIIVKGHYGTEVFPPSSECDICGDRAIGVLVTRRDLGGAETKQGVPLCTTCKEDIVEAKGLSEGQVEYRKFVD
jgi:hypothetical protein